MSLWRGDVCGLIRTSRQNDNAELHLPHILMRREIHKGLIINGIRDLAILALDAGRVCGDKSMIDHRMQRSWFK